MRNQLFINSNIRSIFLYPNFSIYKIEVENGIVDMPVFVPPHSDELVMMVPGIGNNFIFYIRHERRSDRCVFL